MLQTPEYIAYAFKRSSEFTLKAAKDLLHDKAPLLNTLGIVALYEGESVAMTFVDSYCLVTSVVDDIQNISQRLINSLKRDTEETNSDYDYYVNKSLF